MIYSIMKHPFCWIALLSFLICWIQRGLEDKYFFTAPIFGVFAVGGTFAWLVFCFWIAEKFNLLP